MYDKATLLNCQFKLFIRSLDDGFSAYENALIVRRYIRKYGYTEHFKALVGEEGLIAEAGIAIKNFVEWIKKKIREFLQMIKEFFHRLKVRICQFLGIKVNDTPSATDTKDTVKLVKNLNVVNRADARKPLIDMRSSSNFRFKLTDVSAIMRGISQYTLQLAWDLENIADIAVALKDLGTSGYVSTDKCERLLSKLKEACESPGKWAFYSIADVKVLAEAIASCVEWITVTCDTLSDNLAKFESKVEQYIDDTTITDEQRRVSLNNDIVNTLIHRSGLSVEYVTADESEAQPNRTFMHRCMSSVAEYIKFQGQTVSVLSSLLIRLDRIYNAAGNIVHVVRPIDRVFARDLQEFISRAYDLGATTFNPANIIITNQHPYTWLEHREDQELIGEGEYSNDHFPLGWCPTAGGQSGAKDCYINYRAYRKIFENAPLTINNESIRKVLKTVVHECTHMFDAQNDREFDYGPDYNNRPHEEDAEYVAEHFPLTDQHVKWFCDIIRDVRSKVAKH